MANPIMWADQNSKFRRPARRWNAATGELEPVLDDLGRPAFERVPQTGKVGVVRQVEDIKAARAMSEPRSVKFLRDDGNEIDAPIRSAAAAGHGDQGSDNSFARYVLAKAKFYGWIQVGSCPADLVARRERTLLQMTSRPLRALIEKGEACKSHEVGANKPPCRHYILEREARLARRFAEHEASIERGKTSADRTVDALVDVVKKLPGSQPAVEAPEPVAEFAPRKPGK